MSYARRRVLQRRHGFGGVTSQPTGRRVSQSALGVITVARPMLSTVTAPIRRTSLGATAIEYSIGPVSIPSRRLRLASLSGVTSQPTGRRVSLESLGIFGDDAPATTVTDPQWARDMVASQREMVKWQSQWVRRDEFQRWLQLAATLSIPLAAAIWRAIGLGRREQ